MSVGCCFNSCGIWQSRADRKLHPHISRFQYCKCVLSSIPCETNSFKAKCTNRIALSTCRKHISGRTGTAAAMQTASTLLMTQRDRKRQNMQRSDRVKPHSTHRHTTAFWRLPQLICVPVLSFGIDQSACCTRKRKRPEQLFS